MYICYIPKHFDKYNEDMNFLWVGLVKLMHAIAVIKSKSVMGIPTLMNLLKIRIGIVEVDSRRPTKRKKENSGQIIFPS